MSLPPTIHATAVALGDRAVLLLGPSGAGKSDLALRLIDRGWRLVADDRVVLTPQADRLLASAPPTLAGMMEVRGLGIMAQPTASAPVWLAIDLGEKQERLPEARSREFAGHAIPLVALDPFGESAPLKVERALASLVPGGDSAPMPESAPPRPLLIVSGMSGAGKSSALKALEDLGFEAVDNMPLGLVDTLLATGEAGSGPLALGIDIRTRAFDAEALAARIRSLRHEGRDVRLVYFDAADETLQRRFSETRRRHPLSPDRPPADGIGRERELTQPLKRWADIVIDTTEMSVTDLRRTMAERFGDATTQGLQVTVESFGFAHGLPRDADLVFDMRFLANPHWDMALRPLTGEDPAVAAYVSADPAYAPAVDRISDLIVTLLPGYGREGKAYLTIAVGCTGGRHRSVAVARELARRLEAAGQPVVLRHRDVGSHGNDAPVATSAPLTSPPLSSVADAS